MKKSNAGADDELGSRQVHGKVTEVLDAERRRDFAVIRRKADFLPSLAAGDLDCEAKVSAGGFRRASECGARTRCLIYAVGLPTWQSSVS